MRNFIFLIRKIILTLVFLAIGSGYAAPSSVGEMEWKPDSAEFLGTSVFAIERSAATKSTWILYPNRTISNLSMQSRDILEKYRSTSDPDLSALSRKRGTLWVKELRLLESSEATCNPLPISSPQFKQAKVIKFKLHPLETLLTVDLNKMVLASSTRCLQFQFSFVFQPNYSVGNFGLRTSKEMHFSGPIFPLLKDKIYENEITFKNIYLQCRGCQRKNGVTLFQGSGFPEPLHFSTLPFQTTSFSLDNFKFNLLWQDHDQNLQTQIQDLVKQAIARIPSLQKNETPFQIYITPQLLRNNLVLMQPGELQLGTGFYKTPQIGQKYHAAAFWRKFFSQILFEKIVRQKEKNLTIRQYLVLLSLSKILAEREVRKWFKDLESISSISKKLDFLPFFNEVSKGKALVNNDVFLGNEETSNDIDISAFDEVYPTFRGKDLLDRLEWCLAPEDLKKLWDAADTFIYKNASIQASLNLVNTLKSDRCEKNIVELFQEKTTDEHLRVDSFPQPIHQKFTFLRESNKDSSQIKYFSEEGENHPHDTLEYLIEDKSKKEVLRKKNSKADTVEVVEIKTLQKDLNAKIEGPSTDFDSSKHQIPRNISFMITGIRVYYNSHENLYEGQQSLQWSIDGDDYSRALSLSLQKTSNLYFADTDFTGVLTRDAGWKIPWGLGFRNELRKDGGFWLKATTGISNVRGGILSPEGQSLLGKAAHRIVHPGEVEGSQSLEISHTLFIPLGRLTTAEAGLTVGRVQGSEASIPSEGGTGISTQEVTSNNYVQGKLKFSAVLAHDMNTPLTNFMILEHMILFGTYHGVMELDGIYKSKQELNNSQSLQCGLNFLGSFFGSKDQMLTFSMARNLNNPQANNSYSLEIGKAL